MWQIKTYNNEIFIINEVEKNKIKEIIMQGRKSMVELSDGTLITTASIQQIKRAEIIPYFWGNRMNSSKTKVLVEGEWREFAGDKRDIEYFYEDGTLVEARESVGLPSGRRRNYVEEGMKRISFGNKQYAEAVRMGRIKVDNN